MMLKEKERFRDALTANNIEPIFLDTSQQMSKVQCLSFAGKIDGWLAGDDPVDEDVLIRMSPRLKIISKWGTGLDSFDLVAAKRLGVKVTNTAGAFDEAVGELSVGYILSLTREIVTTHTEVKTGHWPKRQHKSMSQLRVGIIGFGAIGQGVAKRLINFGSEIVYHDLIKINSVIGNVRQVSLDELNKTSDVIVLCCNMNANNKGLLNTTFFKNMKPNSYVVNVSRGGLIDQIALVEALQNGKLAGAALDVFHTEPLPQNSELLNLNVILGSHNANNTEKAVEYVHQNTLQNLYKNL